MTAPPRQFGPITSYPAAHKRCKRQWGPARQYPCVECGERAAQWAYDGTDPTQVYGPLMGGSRSIGADGERYWAYFSSYPEFYMPLCGKCHSCRDGVKARDELREYRQWRQRTGLTLADIDRILALA